MTYDRFFFLISLVALLGSTLAGTASAADSSSDAEALLDVGLGQFGQGCAAFAESEARQPGSVQEPHRSACSMPRAAASLTEAVLPDQTGEALLEQGREGLRRACLSFAKSYRLNPTPFALLLESNCDIIRGKTASARKKCLQAQDLASALARACEAQPPTPDSERDGECREARVWAEKAARCTQSLDRKLSYLTIRVARAVPGLQIRLTGRTLRAGGFGTRMAVDPGDYVVSASADGYVLFEQTVTVGPDHDSQLVVVPELERVTSVASGAGPWPWVVGGIGAATVVAGGGSGLLALDSNRRLERECPDRQCPEESLHIQDRRDAQARIATVAIGLGIAELAAAAGWLWLSTRATRQPPRVGTSIQIEAESGRDGAALFATGRF